MAKKSYRTLRLILGDQLNIHHPWFRRKDPDVIYMMMEIRPESEYVTHHIQKILGIFHAMRQFAGKLQAEGHNVTYLRISDADNRHNFEENLDNLIERYNIREFGYMEPDEYRLDILFQNFCNGLSNDTEMVSSKHFITSRNELAGFFSGKKQFLMESFYRHLRKTHNVLLTDEGDPAGGKWNFDKANRKSLPPDVKVPDPKVFKKDVSGLFKEIREADLKWIGEVDPRTFIWPTTREEALELLKDFLERMLPDFGRYQDAISDAHWSLFHSRLSFALNIKLISPLEVVRRVEEHWRDHRKDIDIAQTEGFIRQVLGWREYMRGIYWAKMPDFRKLNALDANRNLPAFFWTGDTKMRCVSKAIRQSLDHAYAHHIQRLMVTGNFCALAGIDPDQVDEWYLGIYIDAFEWVELTNTRGMSQFADGGIVGTKPYVSSANYIDKMGDHCADCDYDKSKRTGPDACPFNSLYWHFIARNRDKLSSNHRMGMIYNLWDNMENNKQQELLDKAESCLENLDAL